jgi:hypothetical protein
MRYEYLGSKSSKPPLRITARKKLWLKRMVVGEGGHRCSRQKASALLWAIVNRWFLWPGARFYPTFISLLRAFSQPINPRWMRGGDLAKKYFGRNAAAKSRLDRRARICSCTKFRYSVDKAVEDFAAGKLFPPEALTEIERSRISNWASLKSTPKKFPHGIDIGGDWFFEDQNLKPGIVVIRQKGK